jgi:signal transduction histidine kinase
VNPAAAFLRRQVLAITVSFSLASALLVSLLAPRLLLMTGDAATTVTIALFVAILLGGALSLAYSALRLIRHRYTLRMLALGSRWVDPNDLSELGEEPARIITGFIVPPLAALGLLATVFRPKVVDITTGFSLALLCGVIVAAASLPLYVLVRSRFLKAIELAPLESMRDVIEHVERTSLPQKRVSQRLLAAVATPVAFLAIGSALVANAHLRRADERQREESARSLARAVAEAGSGVVQGGGLEDALARAQALGFEAAVFDLAAGYEIESGEDGVVELVVPLDAGSARVQFSGSTVSVLSNESLLIALLAVALAGLLGALLGRALNDDLRLAMDGVRLLGTDVVLRGTTVSRPARFRVVDDMKQSIDELAGRFRVFAQAQVRAIESREAATRMRGLFFASVSHDLKSPLNAILGFTTIVRQRESTSEGQTESLALIERRGRELLALIETILDAARVEAGQLVMVHDSVKIDELFSTAIAKGKDLGGERMLEVESEFAEDIPAVHVDRVRMTRALATFIGHAIRTAEREGVRVRALRGDERQVRVEVEVPARTFSARQLEAMLDPNRQPGTSPHRGLALALGLARSVVELHEGKVRVEDRNAGEAVFVVTLNAEPDEQQQVKTGRVKVSEHLARSSAKRPKGGAH